MKIETIDNARLVLIAGIAIAGALLSILGLMIIKDIRQHRPFELEQPARASVAVDDVGASVFQVEHLQDGMRGKENETEPDTRERSAFSDDCKEAGCQELEDTGAGGAVVYETLSLETENDEPKVWETEGIDAEQDYEQESGLPKAGSEYAEFLDTDRLSDDPLSRTKETTLLQSGLLWRHGEIADSIFLMERQLRQAELITQLLEILGPDALIEVAPGKFVSYANTPAGRRVAAEMSTETLRSEVEILEFQNRIAEMTRQDEVASSAIKIDDPADETEHGDITQLAGEPGPSQIALSEITARDGEFAAVLSVDGNPLEVEVGTILPDGGTVAEITADAVAIARASGIAILAIR